MNPTLIILLLALLTEGAFPDSGTKPDTETDTNATSSNPEERSRKPGSKEKNSHSAAPKKPVKESSRKTNGKKKSSSPPQTGSSSKSNTRNDGRAPQDEKSAPSEDVESAPSEDVKSTPSEDVESAPPIQETVVTARPSPGKDHTAAVTSVKGANIRRSTRTSTIEALSQESAGIYVSGRGVGFHGVAGGASGAIHIRGLGGSPNSQVLVVENGVPDAQGIFGHPIPDAYVPFLIDEVRVVMGGDSVLYGSNAVGGVIIIRDRWRTTRGWELNNETAFGSYNTIKETVSFLGRWKSFDLAAAFHARKSDGHRDGAGGTNKVANLAVRWRIKPKLDLTLRNKAMKLSGTDPGPITHPNDNHWYDVLRDNFSLKLNWDKEWFQLNVVSFANIGIHRLYDGFFSLDTTAGGFGEWKVKVLDNLRFLLGMGTEWLNGHVENRIQNETFPVQTFGNVSSYGQVDYRPHSSVHLVAGGRLMYNTKFGGVIMAKAGATWEPWRGFFLRSRFTRNFRQPTLRELYLPFPTANPELLPEISHNWDFSVTWEHKKLKLSATTYYSSVKNLIKYFGAWPSAEVVNIDKVEVFGVEGMAQLKNLGPLGFKITGNWQDVGRYTKQNPDAKINFQMDARHRHKKHSFLGTVSGEWVHGLYMNNYKRDPLPNVFFIDMSLRYRYRYASGSSLEPYIMLRNILDNRYAYIEGYLMPGFNIMAGIKTTL